MKWSYGVTTVPSRIDTLLPQTLASLAAGGFDAPRLFVDGCQYDARYERFGLVPTFRHPVIRTFGNWFLSLAELYIRAPNADRYAIFQDDFVTYRNLRAYLNYCQYPPQGYLNLYTFPQNEDRAPSAGYQGWYLSNQMGRGAVALVFSREAVTTLLMQRHMIERPQDEQNGWKSVDGGIVTAMTKAGWKEYVHTPSLVQHTGLVTSMDKKNKVHPLAVSFRGEDFDATTLIGEQKQETADRDTRARGQYDVFPEPLRTKLIEEWRTEIRAVTDAIEGDKVRLTRANNPRDIARLRLYLSTYTQRLESLRDNNPVYVPNHLKEVVAQCNLATV